ncbi:MAG: S49 family peptidase, partial [Pseudomonadota bacterium]
MHKKIIIMCLLLVAFQGCAFVNVPLFQFTQPLVEKNLEGKGKNKILLIDIEGVITSGKKQSFLGSDTEPDPVARIKEELEKASLDKRIKAVILKINSPGGTVTASAIIHKELLKFKEKTGIAVIACLMDIAASGGYYVANAADKIIAHPTTVTGSIGVIAMKFNVKGLMDKIGVSDETIKSADKKDILSPFR